MSGFKNKMKSFVLSLIVFVLLLCSCKTKEVSRHINVNERLSGDVSNLNEKARQDTTKIIIIEHTQENKVIEEIITTKIYDKDTGNLTKETETKRTIRQDTKTDKVKSEDKGVTEASRDSSNHSVDLVNQSKTKEVVNEESSWSGFTKSLGKWLGIGMIVVLFGLMIWNGVKKKLFL